MLHARPATSSTRTSSRRVSGPPRRTAGQVLPQRAVRMCAVLEHQLHSSIAQAQHLGSCEQLPGDRVVQRDLVPDERDDNDTNPVLPTESGSTRGFPQLGMLFKNRGRSTLPLGDQNAHDFSGTGDVGTADKRGESSRAPAFCVLSVGDARRPRQPESPTRRTWMTVRTTNETSR